MELSTRLSAQEELIKRLQKEKHDVEAVKEQLRIRNIQAAEDVEAARAEVQQMKASGVQLALSSEKSEARIAQLAAEVAQLQTALSDELKAEAEEHTSTKGEFDPLDDKFEKQWADMQEAEGDWQSKVATLEADVRAAKAAELAARQHAVGLEDNMAQLSMQIATMQASHAADHHRAVHLESELERTRRKHQQDNQQLDLQTENVRLSAQVSDLADTLADSELKEQRRRMADEQLFTQLAALQVQNGELEQRVASLTNEKDHLEVMLQALSRPSDTSTHSLTTAFEAMRSELATVEVLSAVSTASFHPSGMGVPAQITDLMMCKDTLEQRLSVLQSTVQQLQAERDGIAAQSSQVGFYLQSTTQLFARNKVQQSLDATAVGGGDPAARIAQLEDGLREATHELAIMGAAMSELGQQRTRADEEVSALRAQLVVAAETIVKLEERRGSSLSPLNRTPVQYVGSPAQYVDDILHKHSAVESHSQSSALHSISQGARLTSPSLSSDSQAMDQFDAIDTNHDGVIDREEWTKAGMPKPRGGWAR